MAREHGTGRSLYTTVPQFRADPSTITVAEPVGPTSRSHRPAMKPTGFSCGQ